jgi:hypothetical protein
LFQVCSWLVSPSLCILLSSSFSSAVISGQSRSHNFNRSHLLGEAVPAHTRRRLPASIQLPSPVAASGGD